MKLRFTVRLFIAGFYLALAQNASASSINLNDFYKDPSVIVAVDGSSAVLSEDASLSTVLLSNDPGLGDPAVISPVPGMVLAFDYLFAEPAPDNVDEFGAFLIDPSTGSSVGLAYEFFTQTSSTGTVQFSLDGLLAFSTLGLQFQLSALPGDAAFDSTVTISNLRLEQQISIPEPNSHWLIIAGFLGWRLVITYRSKNRLVACRAAIV